MLSLCHYNIMVPTVSGREQIFLKLYALHAQTCIFLEKQVKASSQHKIIVYPNGPQLCDLLGR